MKTIICVIIKPEYTGLNNCCDTSKSPLAKGLLNLGIRGVRVEHFRWAGLKWWFIPVGGDVHLNARIANRESAENKKNKESKIYLRMKWFYNF